MKQHMHRYVALPWCQLNFETYYQGIL